MSPDRLALLRTRIDAAIGGRAKALAFEEASSKRFTRKTLQSWIDGKTWPDVAELLALATATGRDLNYFLDPSPSAAAAPQPDNRALASQESRPRTIRIPVLDVEAAAGTGRFVEQVEKIDDFDFPEIWLRKLGGNPRHTHCLRVKDGSDSMVPTIIPKALLMVDRSKNDWPLRRSSAARRRTPPDIYVFLHGDTGIRVKRIEVLEQNYKALISDNALAYPPEIVGPHEPIKIIGKVIWWDNRL